VLRSRLSKPQDPKRTFDEFVRGGSCVSGVSVETIPGAGPFELASGKVDPIASIRIGVRGRERAVSGPASNNVRYS